MLRAELLKISSVTSTTITVLVGTIGLLLTQLSFVFLLPALASSNIADQIPSDVGSMLGAADPGSVAAQQGALSLFGSNGAGSTGLSMIAMLALGLLIATTDFRFGGIVSSALAQPRRGRILLAKLGATTIWAIGLSVVYAAICVVVLLLSIAVTPGSVLVLSFGEIIGALGRGVLAMTMLAWLGLALGVVIRGQLAGFLVLISIVVVEPLVRGILLLISGDLPLWAQFLPVTLAQNSVAASDAVSGVSPLIAAVCLIGLAVAALSIAWARFSRRDV